MERKTKLKEYCSRLLKRTWLLATGGVGFIVTLVVELVFPNVIILIVYAAILAVALVVSGYFVFVDLVKESDKREEEHERAIAELEARLGELESRQPRIVIGFQDQQTHLTKSLRIQLHPLPPEPNYDALIQEKRSELFGKQRGSQSQSLQASIAALELLALSRPNPRYQEEVEEYLVEYRAYLTRRYERKIAVDRAHCLVPIVENQGHCPANSVIIEFAMPEAYTVPEEHQRPDSTLLEEDLKELGISIPLEEMQEMEDARICRLPQEPKPTIGNWELFAHRVLDDDRSPYPPPVEEPSNTDGPLHEVRDGVHFISYTAKSLIQHRPERDFEPFWLWLANTDHSTVWELSVRVFCAELHTPFEDTLFLEIAMGRNSPEDDADK